MDIGGIGGWDMHDSGTSHPDVSEHHGHSLEEVDDAAHYIGDLWRTLRGPRDDVFQPVIAVADEVGTHEGDGFFASGRAYEEPDVFGQTLPRGIPGLDRDLVVPLPTAYDLPPDPSLEGFHVDNLGTGEGVPLSDGYHVVISGDDGIRFAYPRDAIAGLTHHEITGRPHLRAFSELFPPADGLSHWVEIATNRVYPLAEKAIGHIG